MIEQSGSITAELSRRVFGVPTRVVDNVITVGTTPTQIARLNPRRVMISITNHSADVVVLGFSPSMTTVSGVTLAPNGGTATFVATEDGELVSYDMYAVGLNIGGEVFVLEVVGV